MADYLGHAYILAYGKSGDPSTQVGSIIVRDDVILTTGVNHMVASEFCEDPANFERPLKYKLIEHAERDAIYKAAKLGARLDGSTLYSTWAACPDCARAIVMSGIKRVVTHKQTMDRVPDRWRDDIAIGLKIFKIAGVELVLFDGSIGGSVTNLFDGEIWYP